LHSMTPKRLLLNQLESISHVGIRARLVLVRDDFDSCDETRVNHGW